MISHLRKIDKSPLCVNKLVDSSYDFNYFVDIWSIADRNVAFDIVKEARLEWSKASQDTKIVDKKDIIQGVSCKFQDMMKSGWDLEEIHALNSRWEWWNLMGAKILQKTWVWTNVPITSERIKKVVM